MAQNIICYKCKKYKAMHEFPKDRTASRKYHGYCKQCKYKISKTKKHWRKEKYRLKERDRRRRIKKQCVKYKGGKCADCGYNKHIAPMCFHHLKDKNYAVNQLMKNGFTKKLKDELDKCELLCHNCHEIRHYGQYKGMRHKGGRKNKGEDDGK